MENREKMQEAFDCLHMMLKGCTPDLAPEIAEQMVAIYRELNCDRYREENGTVDELRARLERLQKEYGEIEERERAGEKLTFVDWEIRNELLADISWTCVEIGLALRNARRIHIPDTDAPKGSELEK